MVTGAAVETGALVTTSVGATVTGASVGSAVTGATVVVIGEPVTGAAVTGAAVETGALVTAAVGAAVAGGPVGSAVTGATVVGGTVALKSNDMSPLPEPPL
jgi:hypothetical protein